MLALGIMASGSGSNAEAIMKACKEGQIKGEVKVVFSNKKNAYALERGKNFKVNTVCLESSLYKNKEEYDREVVKILQSFQVDTIAMAGYMRIVSPYFIQSFKNRILNIHPALLPAFAGSNGIDDAKNWGSKIFGCTVHFVDEIMDNGAIIIQAALPATFEKEAETKERLHLFEHRIYVQALRWLSEERLEIQGRKTILLPKDDIVYQNPYLNTLVYPPLER